MPLAQDSRPECIRLLKLLSEKKHKEEKADHDSDDDEAKEEAKASKKKPSKKKEKVAADAKTLVDPKKVTDQTQPRPQNLFEKIVKSTLTSYLCYLQPTG